MRQYLDPIEFDYIDDDENECRSATHRPQSNWNVFRKFTT